ncbi:cytochrome C [Geobacter sulfurreducens]|jgi:hypothetical protein|uniref:Cytochrome c, 1 heme-binding site n=1 Tax=Geobacter sulfurreducens (strain ATCC 51573 / DSM 12127 / PCA) TaxID=243231 RepID=Q747N8_GEOSL|nr:cytochrome c [Geobacter sulfurreducens]AAR36618.1 cytochrome c, 1 heme-binding site [Geobacter sulfurreducens PCA]ADI85974.1 cytochrome c, 1 heme-binding site [Geobacter sulfurreducens KN400]AJY69457.1 cytochrome C [Geobacter sulfurreducens]QVW35011.1 cytochrome C [Geobacter sulfurreducens]UAC03882.1 cytochrome C [Geobacter sulfurreducens]
MKRNRRHPAAGPVLISGAALIVGLASGSATAAYNAAHKDIVLKNAAGSAIKATDTVNAFSIKNTCFGTAGCHGDTNAGGTLRFSYDDIERHSYHAQLGANEIRGWNPWNPDSADAFRKGAGPVGKNWVQSPGHVGSW